MALEMIVAMSRNRVIGRDGQMPWHLPDDLRRFRAITWGRPILMGRKTYEAIGRPLPGRDNLVLSRDPDFRATGALVHHALDSLLADAFARHDAPVVIGGAVLYAALLPRAARIHLTRVEADVAGDVLFPALNPAEWIETRAGDHPRDDRHDFALTYLTLDRVRE